MIILQKALFKKILIIIGIMLLILVALPNKRIHAISIAGQPNFITGQEYTLEILATPKGIENAVNLNIGINGGEIRSYSIFNTKNWLTTIPGCTNGKEFTETTICTSLVKEEALKANESLGFVKIKVTDASTLSLFKLNSTEYSDGSSRREDIGELLTINQVARLEQTSTVQSSRDPLIFYGLIGATVSVSIILFSLIILALKKP